MLGHKVLLITLLAVTATVVRAEDESKCQCGVFKSPKPEQTSDTPVASKSPKFDLDCEKEGAENCLNMCKALAEASKEEGPQKLCDILDNTEDPFVPMLYYKACNSNMWTYSNVKPTLKVCCKNKEVVTCA
ncbi:hypothetical protein Phum_PHUM310980 [Pediculus humanus corporis]|uniref:Uncharacterized protein n=1 Tax=Pediculus humanus subsp. corporis TaxID=121224 RepID=E0VMJ6_PEDHC|nr:uncharacterized protein Phum_PHUM310980 [Pediculus humanus corporis]EEB14602.1 hypothetical protein Phum_PHUM310980 [Pediculus humanus corporis]